MVEASPSPSPGPLARLLGCLPQRGVVTWIGLRPARREAVQVVEAVEAVPGQGLAGDRFRGRASGAGKRQVTLIQAEHLPVIASLVGRDDINPALLRRNIAVRGINLLALKDKCFKIGEALFETTGLCHPCSRMEEAFRDGGYNAVRGHGGITARVLEGGWIRVGDEVVRVDDGAPE